MKVVSIFLWCFTPWSQAHYEAGEVVVIKHGTAIEATITALDATIVLTISNIHQLKTMPYMHCCAIYSASNSS